MTQPSVTKSHGSAVLEAKIADLQAKPRPSDVDLNRLARLIEANNADRRWSAGLSRLPRIGTRPPSSTSNTPIRPTETEKAPRHEHQHHAGHPARNCPRRTVPSAQAPSIIHAPRGHHSEKPAAFAEMIERMFPNAPKLELFARKARVGWDVWGTEAPAL